MLQKYSKICNFITFVTILTLTGPSTVRAQEINVAASIRPIHSIVQMVLGETANAQLMMTGTESPHGGALKPSERRILAQANLVFIIDPDFETAYKKALPPKEKLVILSQTKGIKLLERRHGGHHGGHHEGHGADNDDHDEHGEDAHAHDDHEGDEHGHADHDDHHGGHGAINKESEDAEHNHANHDDHHDGHEDEGLFDLHLWLDPDYAIPMIEHIRSRLSSTYPQFSQEFAQNAQNATTQLQQLDEDITTQLSALADKGFITHHDAFAYFEKAYNLAHKAAILNHHGESLETSRIRILREIAQDPQTVCIFHEPQYNKDVLRLVDPDNRLKRAELDPLSADIPEGADFYPKMMQRLAQRMASCLNS